MAILLLTVGVKWNSEQAPGDDIPYQTTCPIPNAYDYFVKAGSLLIDVQAIHNAYYGYGPKPKQSVDRIKKFSEATVTTYTPTPFADCPRVTLSEEKRLLNENSSAIEIVRRGLNYHCRVPGRLGLTGADIKSFPVGELVHLLSLSGDVLAAKSAWDQSARSYIDAMQFASDAGLGAQSGGMFNQVETQESLAQSFEEIVHNLEYIDANVDIGRLELIDSQNQSAAALLANQQNIDTERLLLLLNSEDWRSQVYGDYYGDNDTPPNRYSLLLEKCKSSQSCINDYKRYSNECMLLAKRPWPQIVRSQFPDNATTNLYYQSFRITASSLLYRCASTSATYHLLITEVALQAYYRRYRAYPTYLSQLTRQFLAQVPSDPFSNNAPLKYRRIGRSRYLLYSVGPDCVDNDGRPITYGAVSDDPNRVEALNETGDIAAGVNL